MQAPGAVFQDLANIEMVAMLNEGFCELHHKPYCPPSEELNRECGKVGVTKLPVVLAVLCCAVPAVLCCA